MSLPDKPPITVAPALSEVVLALPHAEVTALAVDHDGVAWIACLNGGGLLAYDQGQLRRFDTAHLSARPGGPRGGPQGWAQGGCVAPWPETDVTVIFVDRDNVKWLATRGGLLVMFDGRAFRIVPRARASEHVERITQDAAGRIWLCGHNGHVIDCLRGTEPDEAFTASIRCMRAHYAHRASDGALWITLNESFLHDHSRLVRFDGARWEEISMPLAGSFGRGVTLHADAGRGVLYVPSRDGLQRYQGGACQRLSPRDIGLGEGSLWLVSLDGRDDPWLQWQPAESRTAHLVRFDGERAVDFSEGTPLEVPDRNAHVAHTPVVIEDTRGRIWIAPFRAGVLLLEEAGWTVLPIAEPRDDLRREAGGRPSDAALLNERRRRVYRHPLRPEARSAVARFDRRAVVPPPTPEAERAHQELFERFARAAAALPAERARPFEGDAGGVFRLVRRAVKDLLRSPEQVRAHLPRLPYDELLELPELAQALRYAVTRLPAEGSPPVRDRLWALLHDRYRHLETIAYYFYGDAFEAHAPDLLRAEAPAPDAEEEALEI